MLIIFLNIYIYLVFDVERNMHFVKYYMKIYFVKRALTYADGVIKKLD